LAAVVLGGPVVVVVVAAYLLVGSGGGAKTANSHDCASYTSQAARDYCNGVTKGDVLDCGDFQSRDEATRFVLAHDPKDTNKLEEPAGSGAYCSSLPVRFGAGSGSQTPPSGSTGSQAGAPTATPKPTNTPAPKTYTVVAGDNPTVIAQKLGVPAADTDSWITEMLALNGASATTLQIGQTLILPPIGGNAQGSTGGTAPADTGGPTGSTGSNTANPTATSVTSGVSAPTATTEATGATATKAAPTSTTSANATATSTAGPTNTPGPTATVAAGCPTSSSGTDVNICPGSVQTGQDVTFAGSGFTPNDKTTVLLHTQGEDFGPEDGPPTDASGKFDQTLTFPEGTPPGDYTFTFKDSHGKTATAHVTVQ
jgi:hypothetical protein